ncbi:MAG: sodium:proton exchanger [Actinomycetota bacterium]|nr:sodium:proton exchanger [Actinomycetota bacterium]
MTTKREDRPLGARSRQPILMGAALGVAVPGVTLRLLDVHLSDPLMALIFGAAIVGAAFLLSWAAEAAQVDVSAGLAIGVLALIAVLPEYAVDVVFAVKGGNSFEEFGRRCPSPGGGESPCSLALANMTGANRLLIGIGWSMVIFIAWWRWRRRGEPDRARAVTLSRTHSVELAFLLVATVYSLSLPFRSSISLVDAGFLVTIFLLYTLRISKAPAEEPHLVGPARWIGELPRNRRRPGVVGLFLVAAAVILVCAEPFAEALVGTGKSFGIDEFLLVQWLAPLASEAPELLVAALYAWRLNTNSGLGTLVSSKVNQWTLLVGTLPIAFAIAAGTTHGLPIDVQQREELFLTAAQSAFAVAILANLSMSVREAGVVLGLFLFQFVAGAVGPQSIHGPVRIGTGVIYLVAALGIILRNRREVVPLLRDGLRTPYAQLQEEADEESK